MKILSFFLMTFLTRALLSAEPTATHPALSEAFGHFLYHNLAQPELPLDFDRVMQGMRDAREGKPSPLSDEEYEQAVFALQEKIFCQIAERNLQEAEVFLTQNALQEGVHVIDPQVHYKILQEGTGACVTPEGAPLIHYKASLLDGTLFASSEEAQGPITLPISQSISGFALGVVGMKEGERRLLYIHPDKAYGTGGHLPPNSLLLMEVEVVQADTPQQEASDGGHSLPA